MELIPALWIKKYKIKTSAGLPFEFDNHYFMRDFVNDLSPFQVLLKPPQIGATESQIIKSFYCAKKKDWDIIYTLPTATDVNDIAGSKINRIVAQNPILMEWVKDHDSVEQKSVGKRIIHYRGTFSAKQAMMVSSDLNIHDEVDASDPSVILQYETRLQAKSDGRRWYFSHPSIVGRGVDIYWQQSDKKEWFIRCPNCNSEQNLRWPENIKIATNQYICSICQNPLTNETRKKGKWKKTSTGIFSGYHISQLMCPWITAEKIIDDFRKKDKQYFSNYVLGLPYADSESKITASTILRNLSSKVNSYEGRIIIGVDTGLPIHYVILNKEGIFFNGKCKHPSADYDPYDELEKLLKRFPTSILVADQGGDLIGIRKLQAKYIGRVFLCFYRDDRKTENMITWGNTPDTLGTVTVDRNRMISMIVEHFKEVGRITLNGSQEDFQEFASHFENIYRELIVGNDTPGKNLGTLYAAKYVWKRNGPDHFVHALLYALVGLDRFKEDRAEIVGGTDYLKELPVGRIFQME